MSVIYVPSGKAREYSPYALNIYLSCTHGCKYCYAPRCRHQREEDYFTKPAPRSGIASKLEKDLIKEAPKDQVLLSFIGDVYCETQDDNKATRDCLTLLSAYNVPTAILTKGGNRCLKDIDLFKRFGSHIQIGTTLTFDNERDSLFWEKGAALPDERLTVLRKLKENGIRTFASFEPVIDPEQSLNLMQKGLDFIDVFKIGKLNNYKGLDKEIDWTKFLQSALDILRPAHKEIYIKYDLRKCAASVALTPEECDPDIHNVK